MRRVEGLDGLRGVLALWVVVVHAIASAGIPTETFGRFAPLFGDLTRVQIFCAMSAFVIFLMLANRDEPYAPYLRKRLRRIYPLYILAFFASAAFIDFAREAIETAPFQGEAALRRAALISDGVAQWPHHFLTHITMTHGLVPVTLLPSAPWTFLGQGWNISTEFQFYLVAPLLFGVLSMSHLPHKMIAIGVIGLVALAMWFWPNPANLARFAPYFILGVSSFLIWRRDWSGNALLTKPAVMAAAILVTLLDVAAGIWIFVIGSALVVRDKAGKEDLVARTLRSKPLLWLGSISYALYLFHMIPLYISMLVMRDAHLGQLSYLVAIVSLTLAIAVPLSWLAHTYIEKPLYAPAVSRSRT